MINHKKIIKKQSNLKIQIIKMMMNLKQMNRMNQNINLQIELKYKKMNKIIILINKIKKSLIQIKINKNIKQILKMDVKNKITIQINLFVKILKLVNKIMNNKQQIKLKLIKVMRK